MWSTLKKFGLQYCDLPTMLWNVSVLLRALTLNIDSRNKKPISLFAYVFWFVIAMSYFYVYVVSMLWFVFIRCRETGDLLAALIVFSLGVASEIGTVKLVIMFLNINKIRNIVVDTLACHASVTPGSTFSNNLLVTLRDVKKRAMIFWIVIVGNGVVYMLKPLLLPGRHLMEDKFILYGLEPIFETPNYQIAFLILIATVIFSVYLPANISAFFIVVSGYVESQMLALAEEILHLWEDAEKHYQKTKSDSGILSEKEREACKIKIINRYIEEQLKDIIKIHGRNIGLLSQIEQVFKVAVGLEFVILGISLIAELLGGLENTYIEIPFAMMQVGMDCFTGQRVMDASIKFEEAVYNCKWENYNVSNMKIVLNMLQSSQKTMTLSAGGVIKLNFMCLMQVNKSIYSAYTTLRPTMD